MATIKCFEDIISWQEARKLNLEVGKLIDSERFRRNYGLINQIERSAGSIMDNIAEGFERDGNRDLYNFFMSVKPPAEN
nr:four helix bundle protein [Ferruginibacter sp. HRS2-29]